jgi:(5-formylfuran-3-yl)methyl phosphate synthase
MSTSVEVLGRNPAPSQRMMPGLLVSAMSLPEAQLLATTKLQWLDLKDPSRGSLGRPSLELIRQFLGLDVPSSMRISIAGGELSEWDVSWSSSLLHLLPSRCYIKFGLSAASTFPWKDGLHEIQRFLSFPQQLIPVFYADCENARCPTWQEMIEFASSAGCSYLLIDTYDKSNGSLICHFSPAELSDMVALACERRLGVALAGSLGPRELRGLMNTGAQWLGVRGAVCSTQDRSSSLDPKRLGEMISLFEDVSRESRERKM